MSNQRQTVMISCILVTIISFCATRGLAEMFSSTAEMETLVTTETELTQQLELYMESQQKRVDIINKYIDKLESLAVDANEHGILHPAVAFLHTVALSHDLDNLISFLTTFKDADTQLENVLKFRNQNRLPDQTDLNGAAIALERLQGVYLLNASQFADGVLTEERRGPDQPKLSVKDCFVMASQLFDAERYDGSFEWYSLVIERCTDKTRTEDYCLDQMVATSLARSSYIFYMEGNMTAAILQAAEAISFDANCSEAAKYLKLYFAPPPLEEELTVEEPFSESDQLKELEKAAEENPKAYHGQYIREHFESLCRDDSFFGTREPKLDVDLHCKMTTNGLPQLLLQPLHVEVLDKDPEIKIFRNFATQEEIDFLIPLGLRSLQRAKVIQTNVEANLTVQEAYDLNSVIHSRTAKNAWINHNNHTITAAISQRVHAATGLDMQYSEQFQLANYGIGGHYDPHFDFFSYNHTKQIPMKKLTDERLATFMLYLTDVEAGGATVFVQRNLTVFPRKGDALFWYNLRRDGHGHSETLHAGCPVLIGSKWVMNLWVSAAGQELIRPCLNVSDSEVLRF